jgi:hypothetical protein
VRIATRHMLMTFVCAGLLSGSWAAAANYASPDAQSTGAETVAAGPARPTRDYGPLPDYRSASDDNDATVGQEEPDDGLFGDSAPSVCEFCGGGHCTPPLWSVEVSAQVMMDTRPSNRILGTASLPGGPFQVTAGTGTLSNGQIQPIQYAYFNNISNTPIMESDSPGKSASPGLDLIFTHFLGRDGENRDYFLQAEYSGLERFYGDRDAAGSMVPIYPGAGTVVSQTAPGLVYYYTGSLISPFPFPVPNLGTTPFNPTVQQTFNPTNAYAFNGATFMRTNTWTTFNNFELNFLIAGNNQQDQMVLNPNGHWYRQCKNGFFYDYLFGFRAMSINEMLEFISTGQTNYGPNNPAVVANPALLNTPALVSYGRYVARTQNFLMGLQTGGSLQYRFCRWELDGHTKMGMFVNFANQDSLVQTELSGPQPDYLTPATTVSPDLPGTVGNISTPYNAGLTQIAFAGGFGVGGSYKIQPNFVAHVSYDAFWVGDIARASDQYQFGPVITPQISAKGSNFYDGVTFGLEYDW